MRYAFWSALLFLPYMINKLLKFWGFVWTKKGVITYKITTGKLQTHPTKKQPFLLFSEQETHNCYQRELVLKMIFHVWMHHQITFSRLTHINLSGPTLHLLLWFSVRVGELGSMSHVIKVHVYMIHINLQWHGRYSIYRFMLNGKSRTGTMYVETEKNSKINV